MSIVDRLHRRYRRRVLKLLRALSREARRNGYKASAPFDLTDEEYSYSVLFTPPEGERVDVTLTLAEEKVRAGKGTGVAFFLGITEERGRILGGMCPYNYSPQLWIDPSDAEVIEERFRMFEQADIGQLGTILKKRDGELLIV